MSLAFALEARASRRVGALVAAAHLCALLGAAAAALQLARGGLNLAAPSMLLFWLPVAWSWRRWRRSAAAAGCLLVDADGTARWCAPAACSLEPLRWFSVAGIAWIEARTPQGARSLLLGRDQASDAQWRSLMRWLRWLDRGA